MTFEMCRQREREMEFSIDLVPGTIPVSMVPYRIST